MKKQFDKFLKMNVNEMAETISEMTYTYVNPKTKQPTEVPPKHYKEILNRGIEEIIEEQLQLEILNTVYAHIESVRKEHEKEFIKSLICMDMGINPKKMTISQKISIEITYSYFLEKQTKEKKKFHFLSADIINKFEECMNDKELQGNIINPFAEVDEEYNDNNLN